MMIDSITLAILLGVANRTNTRWSYFATSRPWRMRGQWLLKMGFIKYDADGFMTITDKGRTLLLRTSLLLDMYDEDCHEWRAALTQFDSTVRLHLYAITLPEYKASEETRFRASKMMRSMADVLLEESNRRLEGDD